MRTKAAVTPDKRSAWLKKLDEECPNRWCCRDDSSWPDSAIMDLLLTHVGVFDMYVEDEWAAYVHYCFQDPMDAEIFRSRFEPRAERLRLVG